MRQIFKSLGRVLLASIAVISCVADANALFVEEEFESDGIHYNIYQADNLPIQMEVIAYDEPSRPELLEIPEEFQILPEYWMRYSFGKNFQASQAIVDAVGEKAFYQSRLRIINLPSTIKRIGDKAFMNSLLCGVELPEGLVYIGRKAFLRSRIESIKIPETVTFLDMGCFAFCQFLETVELPSTFERLGGYVFSYCENISDIYCHAVVPPVCDETDFGYFDSEFVPALEIMRTPFECTVHVPAESVELYKKAPGWRKFEIVPIEEEAGDDDEPSSGVEPTGAGFCDFTVNDGVLTVSCHSGDTLHLYDAGGFLLESRSYTSPAEYTYAGSGVRILSVNGKSYKIML